jgi:hypothetical protein
MKCETLEDRVVLTGWGWGGGSLIQSLSSIGVVTGLGGGFAVDGFRGGPGFGWQGDGGSQSNSQTSQLNTDIAKLQTDLQAIAAKSGVTIADLQNLNSDDAAIDQAGLRLDPQALQTAASAIATAVATGSDTSQAKTDFSALFANSNVTQTTIDKAFADIVQTVTDSKVTGTDLTTIATDQTNIKNDLNALKAGSGSVSGSEGGGTLEGALAYLGVIPGVHDHGARGFGQGGEHLWGSEGNTSSQLQTDLAKLQTDLQAISAKSGVTVGDLTSLHTDSETIAKAGVQLDAKALQSARQELATAIATGGDTSHAKTDFNALFANTDVAQTTIDKAFNDAAQTISDSKVTGTDLTTIATDRANIQNDLNNVGSGTAGSSTTTNNTGTTANTGTSTAATRGTGTGTGTSASSTGSGTAVGTTTGVVHPGGHHRFRVMLRHHRR